MNNQDNNMNEGNMNNNNEFNNDMNNNMNNDQGFNNSMNNSMSNNQGFNSNMNNNNQLNGGPQYNQMNNQYPQKKSNTGLIGGILTFVVIAGIGALAYFLFFNAKTLKCSMSETLGEVKLTAEMSLKFKGGKLSSGTMSESMDLSSYSDSEIEELKNQDFCSENLNSDELIVYSNCKQKIDNKTISISVDVKPGSKAQERTFEEAKEEIEKLGYTCK